MNEKKLGIEVLKFKKTQTARLCGKCRNHNLKVPIVGHKNSCSFENCDCALCCLTRSVQVAAMEEKKKQQETNIQAESLKLDKLNEDSLGGFQVITASNLSNITRGVSLVRENLSAEQKKVDVSSSIVKDELTPVAQDSSVELHEEPSQEWTDWQSCINL